jgi:predicted GIY-YIG superfamily endonuclease
MALREGFDHPDCKVCILLPKLSFLTQTDISQMLGRTNRSIKGFPNLVATCITLGFRPVLDLIANNERNDVVLCEPDSTHSDILDYFAQKAKDDQFKAIESALRAEEWAKNNENNKSELLTENNEPELSIGSNDAFLSFLIPEPSITIKSIVLEAKADILGTNKTVEYSPEILKANAEINIRSCWLNWLDLMTIMARENKLPEEIKRIPPSEMGVYYVINAKTQEWLYVGQSHDLLDRTSDSQRFFQATWIAKEGWQDVFINWKVCDNCDEVEVAMIHELKPKYNDIRYKLK